jgi:hypothetical protein
MIIKNLDRFKLKFPLHHLQHFIQNSHVELQFIPPFTVRECLLHTARYLLYNYYSKYLYFLVDITGKNLLNSLYKLLHRFRLDFLYN